MHCNAGAFLKLWNHQIFYETEHTTSLALRSLGVIKCFTALEFLIKKLKMKEIKKEALCKHTVYWRNAYAHKFARHINRDGIINFSVQPYDEKLFKLPKIKTDFDSLFGEYVEKKLT